MKKQHKLFEDDVFPSLETMRRTGRRVTQEQHVRYAKALHLKPRMGRPPKGKERFIPISFRIAPKTLERVRAQAEKRHVPYQRLMNQILARAV